MQKHRVVQEHSIDQLGEKGKSQHNYDKWETYFAVDKIVHFISKYDRRK